MNKEGEAGRDRRYGILSKNEYFHWMNNQIIFWMNKFFEWIFLILFWMNKFFEWIFLPCNWMNYWMNQKSALFIRKMNKSAFFGQNGPLLPVFHCFLKLWFVFQFEWIILLNEYFFFNFEWIILLNEYFQFDFELNIELNQFLARFNEKMNNQNLSAVPRL